MQGKYLSVKYFVQLFVWMSVWMYLFVYYVCITWACIFVYVCYSLLERVYWYVLLLCYICYIELKKKKEKKRFSLQSSFPREIASLCQAKIPASNLLFGDDTDRLVKSAREQFGAAQHRGGAHSSHRYRRGGSGLRSHSEHRFPAPSSKLWHICLRHWRGTLYLRTAVHWRGHAAPSKRFGY